MKTFWLHPEQCPIRPLPTPITTYLNPTQHQPCQVSSSSPLPYNPPRTTHLIHPPIQPTKLPALIRKEGWMMEACRRPPPQSLGV